MILACSTTRTQARLLAAREMDGPLCQHRKGFVDHLKPKALMTSVRGKRKLQVEV